MLEPIREGTDEEAPRPDLHSLRGAFQGPFEVRSMALAGLFILAALYTLYFARSFLLPIVLALLLNSLLSPVVRALKKAHIPEALGAGIVVFSMLGLLGLGIYELSGPAYDWAAQAPQSLRKVEQRIRQLKKPVQTVSKATEQVEKITTVGASQNAPQKVEVQTQTLGQRVFNRASSLAADGMILVILLFFLLASGDLFLRKLIRALPSLSDKKRAVEIARQIETEISAYLLTVTMINCGLGLALWASLAAVGVPNPLLWGALAAVTNFIPYLGAALVYVTLAMVGFLTYPDLTHALMVPGVFLVLNLLEAYLVTPMVLGRRLTLNPVVIFLGLTFWGWLWGITGAVLAVPIMVVFKIFCDHSEPLRPIGEFLGN
jgi:predicted PurR-regulated permease PerM